MKTKGFLIAAIKSGSGKTTITCAILEALKQRGIKLSAFKCGPDYIDPMFHKRVIGVESRNLDTFFAGPEKIRDLYIQGRAEEEISVIEGVMGLYDGLGGVKEEGSAYHLAQTLDLPVVLVLDAHGMGRTMIAVLAGIMQYDVDKRIAGVILNRISKGYYETISEEIQKELGLQVLGFFPKINGIKLESRHLGLKMPEEIEGLREQVELAAEVVNNNIDVEKLLEIAGQRGLVYEKKQAPSDSEKEETKCVRKRVAVAMDEAFCFYYEDNLRLLQQAGVELVYFSPLHDREIPKNADGMILGGGYPELKASELAANTEMLQSVRDFIRAGKPSIAECGGFMYLHEKLIDEEGQEHRLVGAVPGTCRYTGHLVRFGYVEVTEKEPLYLGGAPIKAHEFHYYESDSNGTGCIATKPATGKNWECIHVGHNKFWGYPHLYYPSNEFFVDFFVKHL
ncbi:MAG: cobyrinate a,c-diamide synthase [Agathobacter sp.]|nr:cobyrinate a,c-diamide synthase [Agathobacter sp.]